MNQNKDVVRYCRICSTQLDVATKPESRDCGGDCLQCMANIGQDPACIAAMNALQLKPTRTLRPRKPSYAF
jgi:hypothetical protein